MALVTSWAGNFCVVRGTLCITGYLAASQNSTHQMLVTPPLTCDKESCLQILQNVPWEAKLLTDLPTENY